MEKFLGRRVVQEFLGTSEIDDVNIKALILKYIERFDQLRKEEDPALVKYHQGYIAALDMVIQIMRTNQKQQLIKEDEE
jgi:dTDP-D-glucose 4,6-dehydratase